MELLNRLKPGEAGPLKRKKKTFRLAISAAFVYVLVSLVAHSPAWAQGPRLEVPVLPICHHPVALEGAPVGFRAAAWVTNIPRPQMAREMVRRARCEVVYNSALPGVGGMTRVLPKAWV